MPRTWRGSAGLQEEPKEQHKGIPATPDRQTAETRDVTLYVNDQLVEFKILKVARRAHSKLESLEFKRAKFGLFRDIQHKKDMNSQTDHKDDQRVGAPLQ
ncbi:hypothetical protein BTVI_92616 [Pitangus sulphuratus]|nr:hypothetical protein BTVI_92616 [Pitangus sulphuratus]